MEAKVVIQQRDTQQVNTKHKVKNIEHKYSNTQSEPKNYNLQQDKPTYTVHNSKKQF